MREPLFDHDAFARRVRVHIAERNIDMRQASKEIGCSHATVSRVCNGKRPDVENFLRIEQWLCRFALPERRPVVEPQGAGNTE